MKGSPRTQRLQQPDVIQRLKVVDQLLDRIAVAMARAILEKNNRTITLPPSAKPDNDPIK